MITKKINNFERRLAALESHFEFAKGNRTRASRRHPTEAAVRRLLEEIEVARIIAEGELDYRHGRARELKSSKDLFKH